MPIIADLADRAVRFSRSIDATRLLLEQGYGGTVAYRVPMTTRPKLQPAVIRRCSRPDLVNYAGLDLRCNTSGSAFFLAEFAPRPALAVGATQHPRQNNVVYPSPTRYRLVQPQSMPIPQQRRAWSGRRCGSRSRVNADRRFSPRCLSFALSSRRHRCSAGESRVNAAVNPQAPESARRPPRQLVIGQEAVFNEHISTAAGGPSWFLDQSP